MSSSKNKSLKITALAAASSALEGSCYDSTCADEVLESLAEERDLISSNPSRITNTKPAPGILGGMVESDIGITDVDSFQGRPIYSTSIRPELLNRVTRDTLSEDAKSQLFQERIVNPSIEKERRDLNFFGRKTTYIIGDNSLGETYEQYLDSKPIVENRTYIPDSMRGRTGAYFSTKQEKLSFLNKESKILLHSSLKFDFREHRFLNDYYGGLKLSSEKDKIISGELLESITAFKNKIYFPHEVQGNRLFLRYNLGQSYTGELKNYGRVENYKFDPSIRLGIKFVDAGSVFNSPYSEDEKKTIKFPMNSLVYDIKTDYNFFIRQYELLMSAGIQESQLPNMYCMLYYENLENPPEELARIYTLDGKIKSSEIKGKNFKGQYFDKFSRIYKNDPNSIPSIKNIYIAPKELAKINEFNSKKVMFPMFADLKFSVSKTRIISNILDETSFLNKFCFKIAEKDIQQEFIETNFLSETVSDSVGQIVATERIIRQSNGTIKYINFEDIYTEIVNEDSEVLENPNILVIDDKKERNTLKDSFLKTINSLILKSKIFSLVKEKNRNYRDIAENRKKCYSETLMYKISKFKGFAETAEPLQNIFLINEPFLDVINYVDTQLKYDQEYFYKIYAYEVIIGNEYEYISQEIKANKITANVSTKPKIMIAQIPFLEKTVRIYDSAPPPPEVSIEYYKGKDNKLLLMFNSSINTYRSAPIPLTPNDVEVFKKISERQNVEFGEPIEFSSDDKIDSYQVFRTIKKPTSYEEFTNRYVGSLNTGNASSASFVDTIIPNTKYYYLFRSIDVHGKPSNPTEVCEIELINENGTIFAIKNWFVPTKEFKKEQSRAFKRFISIQPSIQQTFVNEQYENYVNSNNINEAIQNTNLGLTKPSVWGKKFKIRLVSKQTKKTIDFNIKFDIKKEYLNNT